MMVLLKVENQHVQHVTGNLLLVISEFVSASESSWRLFIHLLFLCAEFSLSNTLSPLSAPEQECSRCELQTYMLIKKPWLQNPGWFAVAEIARVLRCIWKTLKQENDDNELVLAYLDSLNFFISKLPLHLLDEKYVVPHGDHQKSYGLDSSSFEHSQASQKKEHSQGPEIEFLGYLVQLLCSVVEKVDPVEVQSGSFDKHTALCTIINLVPKLCYWCLSGPEDQANTGILIYFRHKLLMLMIRLSVPNDFQCSNFHSWLHLLHSYFQDFLWDPTAAVETHCNSSLEDSPFAPVVPDENMPALNVPHLKRQATYLFLRCSFGLINLERAIDKHCNCAVPKSGLNAVIACRCRGKGLMELHQWLRRYIAVENLFHQERYPGKYIGFASSILQLYRNEDDLLFKLLLQMLTLSLNGMRESHEEGRIPNMEEDFLFHVSNFFNPISTFHIFLAEIHYDHQVLLDYLISKDSGISCAQYLLRCLRILCDKFQEFVEFHYDNVTEEPFPKRRKSSLQGPNVLADLSSLQSLEMNYEGDRLTGCLNQKMLGKPFEEAKCCLFSLKDSLKSLSQNNLFPYNPKALLKRLVEFQELCCREQDFTV